MRETEAKLTVEVSGASEDAGEASGDGGMLTLMEVGEISSVTALVFDETRSRVPSNLTSPFAADCFNLFLPEELVWEIARKTVMPLSSKPKLVLELAN